MADKKSQLESPDVTQEEPSKKQLKRRDFVTNTLLGAGAGIVAGTLVGCGEGKKKGKESPQTGSNTKPPTHKQFSKAGVNKAHVPPGKHDDYYGFWSGGQSGEIRIVGVPSMRELKRIPVFNHDAATGWGTDDYSKKLLGGKVSGDTHHVHLSYKDGTYDGRYVFVNCKASGRLARVSIKTMEVDAIVDIPNSDGTHGIFPQRHKLGYVFCNSEFRTPKHIEGKPAPNIKDVKSYAALHTAIDGETMEVKWQVMIEGNLDLCATDYQGNYSFATCYNSEGASDLEGMMRVERDHLYVFNIKAIEKAVKAGKTVRLKGSKVPVVDARGKDGPYVQRIPVPKSPHGVNIDPTGKYAIASGKLSPTCTVVAIDKLASLFAGKIKPRDTVVAEPQVGLGPLHTCFDGKGNAYTSIFLDSVITKWNIAKAIEKYAKKDKKIKHIIHKLPVHYQVGHTNASMSETKDADGKWLIALCKFSKDRYLNVGLLQSENDQLIDISGEKMELVHDGTAYPEPHDCVVVAKDLIHPTKISPRTGPRHDMFNAWAKEDGIDLKKDNKVIRKGKTVRVYMTSAAPKFNTNEFNVKQGDTVQVILTNLDKVEDLSHGFCMTHHDVNMLVNVSDTNSITFKADKKGVFWYYCPWFCHALHLEMRGRMIVT